MGSCDQHEKRRRGSVYESIWATWHHWGRSQGLSPLLCALCSYTTPGCSAKSVNCIRKQMSTSRSEVTTINYESNFFLDIPFFFLNIVHETYKQIWILPITCIIEKKTWLAIMSQGDSVSGEETSTEQNNGSYVGTTRLPFSLWLSQLGVLIFWFTGSSLIDHFYSSALFTMAEARQNKNLQVQKAICSWVKCVSRYKQNIWLYIFLFNRTNRFRQIFTQNTVWRGKIQTLSI